MTENDKTISVNHFITRKNSKQTKMKQRRINGQTVQRQQQHQQQHQQQRDGRPFAPITVQQL